MVSRSLIPALLATLAVVPAASAQAPATPPPALRDTEPVVMTGESLGDWAAPQNLNAQPPLADIPECQPGVDPSRLDDGLSAFQIPEDCPHNHYADPALETGEILPGTPIGRLLGYRWDDKTRSWQQIPFQVDERFTRYLDNSSSGFAPYSGQDQHTTYAYDGPEDREGFRWYEQAGPDGDAACQARPASPAASDPVSGLDTNDEIAFMADDAGTQAPAGTPLPRGIEAAREIAVADPTGGRTTYVYVMRARAGGPAREFDASNGYVRYERDPNANVFHFSQSSYDNYGNARKGRFWDPKTGTCRGAEPTEANLARCEGIEQSNQAGFYDCPQRRRPLDAATITTDRYKFRYEGRWLMTEVRISPDGGQTYGRDLVDRWKARAFAQDPGSETPCCGFEEEDTNWGGSSTLLGERVGPVRVIRETWGADSGTNVVRRETFYRREVRQHTYLRVHPIPPLDGIYAQWDFNAGVMTRFYNSHNPGGVPVDGKNDEAYGNLDDPCNRKYDDPSGSQQTSDLDQQVRAIYRSFPGLCDPAFGQERFVFPFHQSVDLPDLTFSQPNAALEWSQTSGPHGTIVDRLSADVRQLTPGGAAQSVVAMPYYRDDSCFDDGTGTDPGPKLNLRSGSEPSTVPGTTTPRKCWSPADGTPPPDGDRRFYQGSIATHGVHILFVAESDNARLQMPVNEINAEQRLVMLPGDPGRAVGEEYGRSSEKPLVAAATPFRDGGEEPPAPDAGPNPEPGPGADPGPSPGPGPSPSPSPGSGDARGDDSPAGSGTVLGQLVPTTRCIPARQRVVSRGIGKARIGYGRHRTIRFLGHPAARNRWGYGYCVRGGGALLISFSERGDARLVVSTARRHEAIGSVGPGDRLRKLRRIYPGRRDVRGTIFRSARSTRVLFSVRRKRIRWIAVVDRRLLKDERQLMRHLRNVGL